MTGRRRGNTTIHGWIVIDKPAGMTSTRVVEKVRSAFDLRKVGHAGTLDPDATGVLPVALGEATKTISFCQNAVKTYRTIFRWGIETETDDATGATKTTSSNRPSERGIIAALDRYIGTITQVPPVFSAIKINGKRAYDLARKDMAPQLPSRTVVVHDFRLTAVHDADYAEFEIVCGKGTYVRALARDLARTLDTRGHVHSLRRTRVGVFTEQDAIGVEQLVKCDRNAPVTGSLLPVEKVLDDIPALAFADTTVARLRQGQRVICPGDHSGTVRITTATDGFVGIGLVENGVIRPVRVFNM